MTLDSPSLLSFSSVMVTPTFSSLERAHLVGMSFDTILTDSLLPHQWYVDGIGSCHCCEWHKSANDWRKALSEMKTLKSNCLLCSSEYLGNHIQSKSCDCGCSGSRNIGDSQLPVYVCVTRCV